MRASPHTTAPVRRPSSATTALVLNPARIATGILPSAAVRFSLQPRRSAPAPASRVDVERRRRWFSHGCALTVYGSRADTASSRRFGLAALLLSRRSPPRAWLEGCDASCAAPTVPRAGWSSRQHPTSHSRLRRLCHAARRCSSRSFGLSGPRYQRNPAPDPRQPEPAERPAERASSSVRIHALRKLGVTNGSWMRAEHRARSAPLRAALRVRVPGLRQAPSTGRQADTEPGPLPCRTHRRW